MEEMGKLKFFASMYLETVCDETRNRFLEKWHERSDHAGRKIQAFREKIETDSYNTLNETFRELMNAKKVIMFQTRNQGDLMDSVEYCDITVLASTKESGEDRIDILRSELLEFYRNHDFTNRRPASTVLLDVKDTVRIVQVNAKQNDLAVRNYFRKPCTIAYARLDYIDHLNNGKNANIFFAFLYPESLQNELLVILRHLQGFLSFRHSLKMRIEKDFNGNLFGKRTEELWRIDLLSIEKAGAHTDSSHVNRLISGCGEETDVLDVLFGNGGSDDADNSRLLKLTYNILIAMYYRAVISDERKQFIAADNIENADGKNSYLKVQDLIKFSERDFPKIHIGFGHGLDAEKINNAHLYGAFSIPLEGGKNTGGIPVAKAITFRRKYLRAFLVDILCNIETYGMKDAKAEIYIEDQEQGPRYLVFQNQIDCHEADPELWCQEKNYKLKQSIEFDHVNTAIPKGFSLGCTAHCVQWAGKLVANYYNEDEKTYYRIKLPILMK